MNAEVALFWAVVAGFLVADNLLLVPCGGDVLRFGLSGRFRYEPGTRLQARGRDLVMLNPLNLFHRAALTTTSFGPLTAAQLRTARRTVRRALPRLNVFAWVGYAYLLAVVALAVLSFQVSFSLVLLLFVACHAGFWLAASVLLLSWRQSLSLSRSQAVVHAAEAFFVPAYTMNLGKRLWYRQTLDLPALSLGLHQLKQLRDVRARELYMHELGQRLDELALDIAPPAGHAAFGPALTGASDAGALHPCLEKARRCLTT